MPQSFDFSSLDILTLKALPPPPSPSPIPQISKHKIWPLFILFSHNVPSINFLWRNFETFFKHYRLGVTIKLLCNGCVIMCSFHRIEMYVTLQISFHLLSHVEECRGLLVMYRCHSLKTDLRPDCERDFVSVSVYLFARKKKYIYIQTFNISQKCYLKIKET